MNNIQIYFSDEDIRSMNLSEVQILLKTGELNMSDWALIDEWEGEWGTVGEIPRINTKSGSEKKIRRKTSRTLAAPSQKKPLLFFLIIGIFAFVGISTCLYFVLPPVRDFAHKTIGIQAPSETAGNPRSEDLNPSAEPSGSSPSVRPQAQSPQAVSSPPASFSESSQPSLTPQEEAQVVNQFPYKVFPPLAEAVKNWTAIPTKLFPLPVAVAKELNFSDQTGGSIAVPVGGAVFVNAQRGPQLLVRPGRSSRMQTYVNIDDTTLKNVVTKIYETNVNGWNRLVDKQRQDARDRILAGMPIVPGNVAVSAPANQPTSEPVRPRPVLKIDPTFGTKPSVDNRGRVEVALASIRAKGLEDCQEQFIQRWGVLKQERIQGRPYWTVEVSFLVDSIFGRFPKDAKALIRNGRLEKWVVVEDV